MLQVQHTSIRPLTTAHLAQTMSLLTLSNQELRDKVLSELAANPALELVEERVCPTCHRRLTSPHCPKCSQQPAEGGPIVFLSPRQASPSNGKRLIEEEPIETEPAAPEDLGLHVLQQLAADLRLEDRAVAAYILASLDEDGFLQEPPPLVARATRATLTQVDRVLKLIAAADPSGLGTAGPKQALLAQLDALAGDDELSALARQILDCCFTELGRKEYERIAHKLGVSSGRVRQAAEFVTRNLNPYPARAFWGSGRHPVRSEPHVYHQPDIQISRNPSDQHGPLMVEIFSATSGYLRVNPMFRQTTPEEDSAPISEEWSRHLERAALFVKCLQQRNNTMRRLMEILVERQSDFILNGDRYLEPMTRAHIAEEIGVHESTVSRAVSHKSVALPDGRIIHLDRFFDRSLSVRDQIKEIVAQEDEPLTDDQIVEILAEDGIHIARRTVAKYRAIEGILPARLRQRRREESAARV
jgi:RNA polymerase sigma-54 factor